jgi:hypothetical protein
MGAKGRLCRSNVSMIGIGMSQGPLAGVIMFSLRHCIASAHRRCISGILERSFSAMLVRSLFIVYRCCCILLSHSTTHYDLR